MKNLIAPAAVLVVCAALLAAGCTSADTGAVPAAPVPAAYNTTLASLALTPADLPAGSTPVLSQARAAGEMSEQARDLGWRGGYVTVYTLPANDTGTATVIQSLAVYAEKNITDIIAVVDANERLQTGFVFTDMPLPATGAGTRAFAATPVNATPAAISAGAVATPDQGSGSAADGYIEVIFGKGDILEVIRISGPGAGEQRSTLASLAEAAYAKLNAT